MRKWSLVRSVFLHGENNNSTSNDELVEPPVLKQPRRASSPSFFVRSTTFNNAGGTTLKLPQLRAIAEYSTTDKAPADNKKRQSVTRSMPLSLPNIASFKYRREKTYANDSRSSTQRRYSWLQIPGKSSSNEELEASTEASIITNPIAFRFSTTLLRVRQAKRLTAANAGQVGLDSGSATAISHRDPNRVPLFRLFRATAQSVAKWLSLYRRSAHVSVTAINLTDVMALTTSGGHGGPGGKKEKKSTTTAAVDEAGNVIKFNLDDFKSNVTMKLTDRAKRILSRHPDRRTDEDVHYVMIALKSVPQISEYPLGILRLIVRYGFFESFETRRVLIRQGHVPAAFYFILYGEVAVAVCPNPGEPAKLAVILKRGESFGELAIITGSPRQSTCVTLGYCEFIKLWKEEYVRIFKVGGMANFNNSEVLQFLKNSDLMAGWPLDLLKSNPEVIIFSYFKAGSVVVQDIRKSPWVVILKSGRADAIAVIPKPSSIISEKTGRLQHESEKSARRALGILFHLSKKEFDRELESTRFRKICDTWGKSRVAPPPILPRAMTSAFFSNKSEEEKANNEASRAATAAAIRSRQTNKSGKSSEKLPSSPSPEPTSPRTNSRMSPSPQPGRGSKMSTSSGGSPQFGRSSRLTGSSTSPPPGGRSTSKMSTSPQFGRNSRTSTSPQPLRKQRPLSGDSSLTDSDSESIKDNKKGQRKTMFNILNAPSEDVDDDESALGSFPTTSSGERGEYGFITLQQLGPGNVFGLESHLKLTDCRLLLLSQGCECILLNWNFFRQHCSNIKLAQVQTWAVSSSYPSANAVEEMYQDEINWLSYRRFLINSVTEDVRD